MNSRHTHTDIRRDQLVAWLASPAVRSQIDLDTNTLRAASSDASFRRYFRAEDTIDTSYIVMDAPPDKENCQPFVDIQQRLAQTGVTVPQIVYADTTLGFLILSDLGNTTFLAALHSQSDEILRLRLAQSLYTDAIQALVQLQTHAEHKQLTLDLPRYDATRLHDEMALFQTWFVERHCGATLTASEQTDLNHIMVRLIENAQAQPQVLVHRDYHSRNLMLLRDGGTGILDFQDAVMGPITYDLVSLLKDAYISWEEELILDWVIRYWNAAKRAGLNVSTDVADFHRDFDWMGLQRHLKVLGIFCRLHYRDGKAHYLNDLPVVLAHVRKIGERFDAFKPLLHILDRITHTTITDSSAS
jgi:aminoglycoside/choline kinase family phosphotransferase